MVGERRRGTLTQTGLAHIGIDVGGTFTDVVIVRGDGTMARGKALTTRDAHVKGLMTALGRLAQQVDLDTHSLLDQASFVSVGTTVVTNAIAEMRGRTIGLLVTKGFRDTLKIAKCPRIPTVDPYVQSPMPELVARHRIGEIDERIDASGKTVIPLQEEQLVETVKRLVEEEGIQALAVCYLWSFLNPVHERRTRAILAERFPDLFLSVSSELYPVIREYERMVTTSLNAFVSEVVGSYVVELDRELAGAGFGGRVYLGQSLGGVLEPSEARDRPLHLFNSGPVGGVIGARRLADVMGIEDLITADMGGTSFDVSLVRSGTPEVTHHTVMERFETGLSEVDISAVGAGGGSICWIDERGAPRVGPQSAGADPGPVCYGRGGERPTVTDVAAALGLIDPDYFLGGEMRLDVDAARRVIENKLAPVGDGVEEIAPQFFKIIVSNMLQAVRKVSIQRGYDPRGLRMFAYGGACGLFAAEICRGVGIDHVVVPNYAAVFSALGLLAGDAIRTEAQTVQWMPESAPLQDVDETWERIRAQAVQNMRGRGFSEDEIDVTREADMRFAGQSFDVTIELPDRPLEEDDRETILTDFKRRYGELYGPGSVWTEFPVVLMTARIVVRGRRPKPDPVPLDGGGEASEIVQRTTRTAFLPGWGDWAEVACYEAGSFPAGAELAGPCIVEDVDTTILVPSDARVNRERFGGFELSLGRAKKEASA